MENGLCQSCAYGTLNPGVITSRQHLKWVHCLRKTALMQHFMSTCYSPERQQQTERPQLYVFWWVITVAALERGRYTVVLPFQICICFTLVLRTLLAFIYCSLVRDTDIPQN